MGSTPSGRPADRFGRCIRPICSVRAFLGSCREGSSTFVGDEEDNLTLLVYRGDRVPNEVPDTEEVVLGVCKNEGLQQVVWISRFFSGAELNEKLEAVLAEGTRRYGRAEISEQGIISWNAGRTFAVSKSFGRDLNRILMASAGPEFDPCSEEHKSMTGHPLNDHWMRFLTHNR